MVPVLRVNINVLMELKRIAKRLFPSSLWRKLRKRLIFIRHRKLVTELSPLVDGCLNKRLECHTFERKVLSLGPKRVIWQYWAQGYDDGGMPELVRLCLASVDKYASDYRVIRLSDENLSQYVDMPDWLVEKRKQMPIAHFSDLLRCILLSVYGGVWLDACTLLTGRLPDYVNDKSGFFMYQRDSKEPHKEYWENTFAYYFGWNEKFRVNVLIGIMSGEAGNKVISDMCTMLMSFWKEHERIPDYFFFQILFDIYIKKNRKLNCVIMNDCVPHILRQIINEYYPYCGVGEVLKQTSVHSLNYKNPKAAGNLKALMAEYRI